MFDLFVFPGMTFTNFLAIIAMVVSAGVAHHVAYMHRRQIRQIELFKRDPTVGIMPPPSALNRSLKSRWDYIFGISGPLLILYFEFRSDEPITRFSVFTISACVVLIAVNFVMLSVFRVQRRLINIMAIQERHLELTARSIDLIRNDENG